VDKKEKGHSIAETKGKTESSGGKERAPSRMENRKLEKLTAMPVFLWGKQKQKRRGHLGPPPKKQRRKGRTCKCHKRVQVARDCSQGGVSKRRPTMLELGGGAQLLKFQKIRRNREGAKKKRKQAQYKREQDPVRRQKGHTLQRLIPVS